MPNKKIINELCDEIETTIQLINCTLKVYNLPDVVKAAFNIRVINVEEVLKKARGGN